MLVRTLEKKPERGILSSVSSAEMSRINIIILLVDLCILTSISGECFLQSVKQFSFWKNDKNSSNFSGAPGRSRIVNGEIASVGEFPFVAELKLDGYFRCGGLIYNANYVITSAICVNGRVIAGSHYEFLTNKINISVFFKDIQQVNYKWWLLKTTWIWQILLNRRFRFRTSESTRTSNSPITRIILLF